VKITAILCPLCFLLSFAPHSLFPFSLSLLFSFVAYTLVLHRSSSKAVGCAECSLHHHSPSPNHPHRHSDPDPCSFILFQTVDSTRTTPTRSPLCFDMLGHIAGRPSPAWDKVQAIVVLFMRQVLAPHIENPKKHKNARRLHDQRSPHIPAYTQTGTVPW